MKSRIRPGCDARQHGGGPSSADHLVPSLCQHQVEPDPAEMAAPYGADTSVLDWRLRLVCSKPLVSLLGGVSIVPPIKLGYKTQAWGSSACPLRTI